ncbi:oxygenase MpaB family protein [Streptomyces sp. NPDC059740]|uniref:oxygenase MpaB family protein n=1 Tax=Streptomyces sp. NPDC059740 TaxID=3346926 RepID=UPI0036542D8C
MRWRGRDAGWFGPGSVTWQLHSDPVMWIAGVRALYLQALHPGAVQGVLQNSDFRRDAWGRLLRTARFVAALTYGRTEDAEEAAARVRRVHRHLSFTDPVDGRRRGVDEPELLLWVHCAEVDSYLAVVRRSGLPLNDAQADAYVREQRASAALVGLDPTLVPGDTASLDAYLQGALPGLSVAAGAREVEAFLRRPPVPLPLLPLRATLWRHLSGLAYDTLPPFARDLYGRPSPPPEVVTRRLRRTGAALRALPARLRWSLPPRHILRAVARLGPGSRPAPGAVPAVPVRHP